MLYSSGRAYMTYKERLMTLAVQRAEDLLTGGDEQLPVEEQDEQGGGGVVPAVCHVTALIGSCCTRP